jgi:hypothetical protein
MNNLEIVSMESKKTIESPCKTSKKIESQADYLQLFCDKFGEKSEDENFQNQLASMEKNFQDKLMSQPPIDLSQKKDISMFNFFSTFKEYYNQLISKELKLFSKIKYLDYQFYREMKNIDQYYQVVYKNALRAEVYDIDSIKLLFSTSNILLQKIKNLECRFGNFFKDFYSLVKEAHQKHKKTLEIPTSTKEEDSEANEIHKTLEIPTSIKEEDSEANEMLMNKIFYCLASKLFIFSTLKRFEPSHDCYKEYIPDYMRNNFGYEKYFQQVSNQAAFTDLQDCFTKITYIRQVQCKIKTFLALPYYNEWIQKPENFIKFYTFQSLIISYFNFYITIMQNVLNLHSTPRNGDTKKISEEKIKYKNLVEVQLNFGKTIEELKRGLNALKNKANELSFEKFNSDDRTLYDGKSFLEICLHYEIYFSLFYHIILHKKLFSRFDSNGTIVNLNEKSSDLDSPKEQQFNSIQVLSIGLSPVTIPKKEELDMDPDQIDMVKIGHQLTAILKKFFNDLNNGGFAYITSPLDICELCKVQSEIYKLQNIVFAFTKNIRKNFTELDVDNCSYNTEKYILSGDHDSKYFDPIWDLFLTTMDNKTQKLYQEFKEIIADSPYGLLLKKINTKIRLILEIMDIKDVAKQDLLTKFIIKMESLNKNPEGLKTIKEKLKYNGYPGQIALYFQTTEQSLEAIIVSSDQKRILINNAFQKADDFLNEFFESWAAEKPHINPEIIFYGKTHIFKKKQLIAQSIEENSIPMAEPEEEKTPPQDVKFSRKQLKQLDKQISKEYKKQLQKTASPLYYSPPKEEIPLVHQPQTTTLEAAENFKTIIENKIYLYNTYQSWLQDVKTKIDICGNFLGIKNINLKTLIKQLELLQKNPEPLDNIKDEINDTQKYEDDSFAVELESFYNLNKINKLIKEEKAKLDKFHRIIELLSEANNYLYDFIANWAQENSDEKDNVVVCATKSLFSRPTESQPFYQSGHIPKIKGNPRKELETATTKKMKDKQVPVPMEFKDAIDQKKEMEEAIKEAAKMLKEEKERQAKKDQEETEQIVKQIEAQHLLKKEQEKAKQAKKNQKQIQRIIKKLSKK